ncbi:MAG: hypothetical protein NC925_02080 [Candidatus Omnitrophica bacterium]|nr:hypothetical protein [Candidatus Omnitrophota bacterium]MCM8831994.1 hypothetical protein [Candidatus Omnitrophota bacterium]
MKIFIILLLPLIFNIKAFTEEGIDIQKENISAEELINKAWGAHGRGDIEETFKYTNKIIELYKDKADKEQKELKAMPTKKNEIQAVSNLNNVATAYFIQAESYRSEGKLEEAKKIFELIIDKYPFAQAYDPRGWFWSISEKAKAALKQLEKGGVFEEEEETTLISKVKLYDEGEEFPVDYSKYGEFVNVGSSDYQYIIKDQIGLAKAVGEGIYPNTNSIKFNPEFVEIKKELDKIDHWKILNSRDLKTAFFKWNTVGEPLGVRQFYVADILERSGLYKHAIKAYYSILVHFPKAYSWTYWHTPWYIGPVALYRIKHILKEQPHLNLELKDASIEIINGFDNNIRNDIFIVNPGKLVKKSMLNKISLKSKKPNLIKRKLGKIVEVKGKGKVKLVRYSSGDWQLLVDGKPFIIKGITYSPTRVGESPDKGTLENWTFQDINQNGLIDAPFEACVDKNKNNICDPDEPPVGDFQLLKEMGVNTIRLYHQPFKINKELIGQMHQKYGIYILIGDFLGKYALGCKTTWEEGCDYDNPQHQQEMLNSVKEMVEEFKDEPAVLFWLLGNENVYGVACNADKKPESFFKFANKAAKLIKSLDPLKRPVAIASGDTLYLDIFAKNCPDIDIYGANVYRGKYGFLDFWTNVKKIANKPAIITEYGAPSYAVGYSQEEAQDYQALYHRNAWIDIYQNSCGFGEGNSLGGFIFEWLDEWWKAYEPSYHDKKGLFTGPFLDGYMHEEWLGIAGQGDGSNSPFLRQLKKAYFEYKKLWQKN